MSVQLPAFGESFVSAVDEANKRLTITSASFPLILTQGAVSGEMVGVPADYDLVIRADRVLVKGTIRLPGRNVFVVARVLEGEGDAGFITNGENGAAPPPPKPMSTFQPQPGGKGGIASTGGVGGNGIAGDPGNEGAIGKPAGNITLHVGEFCGHSFQLHANGGAGGAGQNGQAGVPGARGGQGGDPNGNPDHNPAGNGGNGGVGGNGGRGGTGGVGGANGRIIAIAFRRAPGGQVFVQASPGAGGAGGIGGGGGAGGAGGPAGDSHGSRRVANPGAPGGNGANGDTGTRGASPAAVATDVRQGSLAEQKDSVTLAQLQMILRLGTLRLLLRDTNRQDLAERLAYVRDFAALRVTADDAGRQFDAASQRANALLFQNSRGLDPQGHPENYAPRLDIATYKANLDRFVANFKALRDDYRSYFRTDSTRDQRIAGLKALSIKASTLITDLDAQAHDGLALATGLIPLCDDAQRRCALQLVVLQADLTRLETELKQVAKNTGCVLDTLGGLTKGLDALALSGDARVKKVAGYGHDAEKMIKSVIPADLQPAALANAVTKLESLGDDLKDLASAYSQNKDLIINLKDPNAYKLLVDQQQLNAILKPYLDKFDTAQEAKKSMDEYVKRVQTRNEAILRFNTQIADLAGVKARRAEASAQKSQADTLIASNADPMGAELASFAGNAFRASKELCVEQLYLTGKAAVFYSLDRSFNVFDIIRNLGAGTDLDWSAFQTGADQVVKHLQTAEERFGQDTIAFPQDTSQPGAAIVVRNADGSSLTKLSEGIAFTIAPAFRTTTKDQSPFYGMADVRITRVRVWVEGARTSDNELTVLLTQLGQETIVNLQNQALEFVHSEVGTRLVYDLNSKLVRSGGDIRLPESKYAAVGPFGTWVVKVLTRDNRGLDLSAVKEVRVEFHVKHRLVTGLLADGQGAGLREIEILAGS
jgi:hypothetical protein